MKTLITQNTLHRDSLIRKHLKSGSLNIKITGTSMRPFLNENDVVTIKRANFKTGDILVFIANEKIIAHRVFKCFSKILTKGDNNSKFDNYKKIELIGKVVQINGKKYLPSIKNKLVIFCAVVRDFLRNL